VITAHSVVAISRRCDVEGSQYKFVGGSAGGLRDERKFCVWKLFPDFEILGGNGEIPKSEHVTAGDRYMSDFFPGDFVNVQIDVVLSLENNWCAAVAPLR
jgi:hypothetical protein